MINYLKEDFKNKIMKKLMNKLSELHREFRETPVRDRDKTTFGMAGNRVHGLLEAGFGAIIISGGTPLCLIGGGFFYAVGSFNALTGKIMYIPSKIYEQITGRNFWENE